MALNLIPIIAVGTLKAQELRTAPISEPQYINSFFAVDAVGKLIELERQTVTFKTKMKVLPGYASVKMTTQFKPGTSSVGNHRSQAGFSLLSPFWLAQRLSPSDGLYNPGKGEIPVPTVSVGARYDTIELAEMERKRDEEGALPVLSEQQPPSDLR
jgi:hypothetical protein